MTCRAATPFAVVLLIVALAAAAFAQHPPKNFVVHSTPKPIPDVTFEDDQGRVRTLSEFRGKIILLNIWATWCPPCRREMPSLDRLQGLLGGTDFQVVALSIDRAGIGVVRKFYSETGLRNLAIYIDTSGSVPREIGMIGVPATLLIDREGRELGRLSGPAEWDAPETVKFLRSIVARGHSRTPAVEETTRNARHLFIGGPAS